MEADVMRKCIISGVIVLSVFIYVQTMFGQPSEGSKQGQTEELENIQEQWPNMSKEEKAKLRADIRGRAGAGTLSLDVQLQAVKMIDEEVAKLKSALEGMIEVRKQYRNMTDDQRSKIGKMSIARQQAIAAIEQQLEKLRYRGQRQQVQAPQIRLDELQEIQQLAVKEKATETAKRLESFISSYQSRQIQTQAVIQKLREQQAERIPRQQQSKSQEEQ
jgi:hypothetical protein